MPPRFVTVLIVLFWLGTGAWFFQREVWPSLRSGDPPPFVIDLVDEARQLPIDWVVFQGDKKVGKAITQIGYDQADDSFRLEGQFVLTDLVGGVVKVEVKSMYRVTRAGELRQVDAHVDMSFPAFLFAVAGDFGGPVQDGTFQPEARVTFPGETQKIEFDPVRLSGRGSVLNPLQPVNRLTGLRPGRTWQIPLFNPLQVLTAARIEGKNAKDPAMVMVLTVMALLKGKGTPGEFRRLNATVLDGTQSLFWDDHEEICLVIEYRDDDRSARTWVRQKDGTVLQQEVNLGSDQLVLKRVSTK
jgi:hypothetical protein